MSNIIQSNPALIPSLVWLAILLACRFAPWWKRLKTEEVNANPKSTQRLKTAGWIENSAIWVLSLLPRISVHDKLNSHKEFRAKFADSYVVAMCILAVLCAFLKLGEYLWLIAVWRIVCLLLQFLSVGIFLKGLRYVRGEGPPWSNSRMIAICVINAFELVALYALLYQVIHGSGIWLYESFTTQVTMSHSTPIDWREKLTVASQISMSLLLISTIIGNYVGVFQANEQSELEGTK